MPERDEMLLESAGIRKRKKRKGPQAFRASVAHELGVPVESLPEKTGTGLGLSIGAAMPGIIGAIFGAVQGNRKKNFASGVRGIEADQERAEANAPLPDFGPNVELPEGIDTSPELAQLLDAIKAKEGLQGIGGYRDPEAEASLRLMEGAGEDLLERGGISTGQIEQLIAGELDETIPLSEKTLLAMTKMDRGNADALVSGRFGEDETAAAIAAAAPTAAQQAASLLEAEQGKSDIAGRRSAGLQAQRHRDSVALKQTPGAGRKPSPFGGIRGEEREELELGLQEQIFQFSQSVGRDPTEEEIQKIAALVMKSYASQSLFKRSQGSNREFSKNDIILVP